MSRRALALAPQAQARETAKFEVLSIPGTDRSTRDVAYAPSIYGSCAWSQIERIRFHSNFTQVEVPGEVTVSRSATYQQTDYFDPDTGETLPGCYYEPSPVDCTVERTLPAT